MATWFIEDIPFDAIDREKVARDDDLLYTIASASFVEITSDLYTDNLVEFFRADAEAVQWLRDHWQREELQHGAALKRYVQAAWPDFPWQEAYQNFYRDYSTYCSVEQFAPGRALEMAARCVIETGTATFYKMLSEAVDEPVLSDLTAKISADEVGHYKHFYSFFCRFRENEHPSYRALISTLWHRLEDINDEDAYCALKAAFLARNPNGVFDRAAFRAFRRHNGHVIREHFPFDMAVKMYTKPLELSPPLRKIAHPLMVLLARQLGRV